MARQFDFNAITTVEFGVCIEGEQAEEFYLVPANNNVKQALKDMLSATIEQFMDSGKLKADKYEPSEKHASSEKLHIALDDDMNAKLRELYAATNIQTDTESLRDPNRLVYYFAVFHDKSKGKVVAVRRAQYFRGIAKQGNILVRMIDDSLDLIDDNVFKLDRDFDYFICDNTVYILRPSGFEFTAGLETYILERGAENALDLGKTISFLDTSGLSEYVKTHKRAARLLASIRTRGDLDKTSLTKFKKACKANGIDFVTNKGIIAPAEGHEMGFLLLLDRRRYTLSLTDDGDELLEATSRRYVK